MVAMASRNHRDVTVRVLRVPLISRGSAPPSSPSSRARRARVAALSGAKGLLEGMCLPLSVPCSRFFLREKVDGALVALHLCDQRARRVRAGGRPSPPVVERHELLSLSS